MEDEKLEDCKIYNKPSPRIWCLEGCHGTGKTTLGESIQDDPRFIWIPEGFLDLLKAYHFFELTSPLMKEQTLGACEEIYSRRWFERVKAAIEVARNPNNPGYIIIIDRSVFTQTMYPRGTVPDAYVSALIFNNLCSWNSITRKHDEEIAYDPKIRIYNLFGVPTAILRIVPPTSEAEDEIYERVRKRNSEGHGELSEESPTHFMKIINKYKRLDVGNMVPTWEFAKLVIMEHSNK